nr:uncharacterized protein LOC112031856 [Quercus suber]
MKKTAIVDDCPGLNDVVLEVVKECKGLPIAIITVGKALTGKSLNDWNVAMHQLRKSRLVDIEGVDEDKNAYACLKWSFDQLKRKTKLCFLLCSLFPEDYNIAIEELTRYVMGLEEDEDFHLLEDARCQVRAAINSLKDSSLLLEGYSKEFVKMHDMVRDIGLWITSKGENEFEIRACTRLERNTNFERATAISLIDFNTKQLPDKLVCPRLNILLLGGIQSSKNIPNALFEGMNCLKVLALHYIILSSQSLELLTNLRALYLENCNFSDDLSSLGKLKKLETLSFCRCGINALPSELGGMASLKMIYLTFCDQLRQIPPNVIRSLSQLEELIIDDAFLNWDVEGTTSEISNANLSELNSLPRFVILSLKLHSNHLPKGFVFPDLHRYFISINWPPWTHVTLHDNGSSRCIDSRTLEINDLNASSMNALKPLFRTVEYLWIKSCEMECIVDTIGGNHTVTSRNLVKLYLKEMSCLRTICEGPNQYEIFSNLTDFEASGCPRLISLFSPSLAQSLKKLKRLSLDGCDEMKQIISEQGMILESHGQPICLPKLETLVVENCENLEYIFPISVARGLQQLESLKLLDLRRLKKVFGQNREGEVGDCEIESHHQPTGFPKLKTVQVLNCENLEYILPISIAQDLPQLESLELQRLPQLKKVFGQNREGEVGDCEIESHGQPTGFPKLKTIWVWKCENLEYIFPISVARGLQQLESLKLLDLRRLKKVFGQNREGEVGDCEIESHHQPTGFPKLEMILVRRCKNLEYIFPISIARGLPQLESLDLGDLPQLKKVFGQNREREVGDCEIESHGQPICLPKLETLEVENCENLEYIFPISVAQGLQQLESLTLVGLLQLKKVFGHEEGGDDGDGNNNVLSKLRKLRLENLPELDSLGGGNSSSVWRSSERLYMVNCPKVKSSFFANVEENVPAPQKFQNLQILSLHDWNAISFDWIQGLSNLEELEIKNCGGIQEVVKLEGLLTIKGEQQDLLLPRLRKMLLIDLHELRCICKGTTKPINLNNLEDLKVIGCKKLTHLFTPALAQSLQKLKFLEIERCDELEHLIVENAEEHVSSKGHLQPSCFPKLNVVKVKVKGCNKLKRLFHVDRWNPVSIFLTLEELEINKCGGLQVVFNFEGFLTKEGEQQDEFFPRLRKMCLVELHELTYIWKGPIQLINFNNLEDLKVIECKKLTHLFTPALAQSLQKLKFLEIERCDELEHLIVENVEEQSLSDIAIN